jgi:hypothetical protein
VQRGRLVRGEAEEAADVAEARDLCADPLLQVWRHRLEGDRGKVRRARRQALDGHRAHGQAGSATSGGML